MDFGDVLMPRVVVPGLVHRLPQRGNRRRHSRLFDEDYCSHGSEVRGPRSQGAPTLHFYIASRTGPFGIVGRYRAGNGGHIWSTTENTA